MSDRGVQKQKKQPKSSTERKYKLLSTITGTVTDTMPSCSNCEEKGFATCGVSPLNPNRCLPCVQGSLSHCDVQEFSVRVLERAGKQFHAHEAALERAEEELQAQLRKIERLRTKKKMWFEKMMRAVRRGISSVEELEKVEREEAEREEKRVAEQRPPSSSRLPDDFELDWNSLYPSVDLSPGLIADLGFVGDSHTEPGRAGG
jgi:hypothetical protein